MRTSGLTPGQVAGPSKVRDAISALYGLGLFSNIRVREEADSTGARVLVFEVTENPRIGTIRYQGNKALSEDDLKAKVDLKPEQLLNQRKVFEARRAIELAYAEKGYASASVDPQVSAAVEGVSDITFVIDEGRKVDLTAIDFSGAHAFPEKTLRGVLSMKPNSFFHRKRFTVERLHEDQDKLESYYRDHGYKDAQVTSADPVFSEDRHEVRIRYEIHEGRLYRFGYVTWQGNTAISTEALQSASQIVAGEPFSKSKVEGTTSAAYALYTEKGYLLQLQISPDMKTTDDSVSVAYSINEGEPSHVNEVLIQGNTRTKEKVIRRELSLIPGQLLRRSALLRSQRDLMALGYFEDVSVDYQPAGVGSAVDVTYTVKEKSSGTATAGAAYASDTGLTGFVEFGHNNLFGNGQAVNVHLERGDKRVDYDISFTEPWLRDTPTSLELRAYDTIYDYDVYSQDSKGASINLGRPWFFAKPDYSRVYAGYSLEHLDFTNLSTLDPTSQELLEASNGTASLVTLSFVRTSTDNPFNPLRGSKTTLSMDVAGGPLGGTLEYFRPLIDHRVYFVPFWKPVIMIRNRFSYLGAIASGHAVPGSETFRLGGTRADYLRGYPDYWVVPPENVHTGANGQEVRFPGGTVLYTFTTEYQFPIVNPVRGLLFFDAGNTWNHLSDLNLGNLDKGVGAGLRVEIPMLGLVGLDYGYGIDRGRWQAHFIIGPAF